MNRQTTGNHAWQRQKGAKGYLLLANAVIIDSETIKSHAKPQGRKEEKLLTFVECAQRSSKNTPIPSPITLQLITGHTWPVTSLIFGAFYQGKVRKMLSGKHKGSVSVCCDLSKNVDLLIC